MQNKISKYAINTAWWYHWCDFVNVSVDEITKMNKRPSQVEEQNKTKCSLSNSRDTGNLK